MGADFRDYPVSMISTKIEHQKVKTWNVCIEVVFFFVGDVVSCLRNIQWTETWDLDCICFTQKTEKDQITKNIQELFAWMSMNPAQSSMFSFKEHVVFSPLLGKMIQIDWYFFRWVENTNLELYVSTFIDRTFYRQPCLILGGDDALIEFQIQKWRTEMFCH